MITGARRIRTDSKSESRRQVRLQHVIKPLMPLCLIEAADNNQEKLLAAQRAYAYIEGTSMAGKAAIIRKHVPWEEVSAAIWGNDSEEMSTHFAMQLSK